MEMTKCTLCNKIFGSTGKKTCSACGKQLDELYEKARNYLRDNPKEELDAQRLAKAIEENPRMIHILIEEGRFIKGHPQDDGDDSAEEKKKQRLLEELQKTVEKQSAEQSAAKITTYGKERHSR